LIGIYITLEISSQGRHGPKAFGEWWLQVSKTKMRCQNEFGSCNWGKLNLEMEWLGCGPCYHWWKLVKEARGYECRYT